MNRTAFLLVLMLLLAATPAAATIYQCLDAKGNLFLTDDPESFPPGCQPEEVKIMRQETKEPQARPANAGTGKRPDLPDEEKSPRATANETSEKAAPDQGEVPRVEQWKKEAQQLAGRYGQAEENAAPAPAMPPAASQNAEVQREQLRRQIEDFRIRLAQAPLTPEERDAVEQELPPVEEPAGTPAAPGTPPGS